MQMHTNGCKCIQKDANAYFCNAKRCYNDNVNENDNDNVNVNVNENEYEYVNEYDNVNVNENENVQLLRVAEKRENKRIIFFD